MVVHHQLTNEALDSDLHVFLLLLLLLLPLTALCQVSVSSCDIDFRWSITPHLPAAPPAAAAADAATAQSLTAAAAADDDDAGRHYGILLARMAGLPSSVTDAALQIARRLDTRQQQRQQQQEGDGSMQRLRQVYSLVHKLGCVARAAAAQGVLPTDTAGQLVAADDGELLGSSSSSSRKQAELSKCMQMVQQLKGEAEKLLLTAARLPDAA